MLVYRDGGVIEVKRAKPGDIYPGKCWLCGQNCLVVWQGNQHEQHIPMDVEIGNAFNDYKLGSFELTQNEFNKTLENGNR